MHVYSRYSQRTTKTVKEYVFANAQSELIMKHRKIKLNMKSTMHNEVL